ncbi:MAG TPA: nuclear transport factor 2 family protein [Blastocatellia bacterium]|nr:nuclear transport factor 2 family protein [Blastocatellia bacterium]
MTKPMMEFAEEWIAAWNSHDLDRILSHYAADVVFTSPRAAARLPHTRGTVRGIEQLREYWAPLAEVRPHLKFTLEGVLETVGGCTILYRDETGLLVAETMLIEAGGKVVQGIVSHAAHPFTIRKDKPC